MQKETPRYACPAQPSMFLQEEDSRRFRPCVCEISSETTTTARMILLLRILTSLLQLSCAFSHFCSMCKLSIYRVVLPGELIAVHPFPKER